jgi:hypothetical protein
VRLIHWESRLDIICAKCGKHFSSIESARGHYGHCKGSLKNEELHWIPSRKNKLTPEEWGKLLETFSPQSTGINQNKQPEQYHDYSQMPLNNKDKNKKMPPTNKRKLNKSNIPKWVFSLILIFVCLLIGLTINLLIDELFPIFLLIGFAVIFSIEKWFSYYTKKYKAAGIIYRLFLNLSILSLLIILILFGINLFSHQLNADALISSLIFIAGIALFIWLWIIVNKNSWRRPSMKLTLLCVVAIFLIFAFAGVEPMSSYKNNVFDFFSASYQKISEFVEDKKGASTQSTNTTKTLLTSSATKTNKTAITSTTSTIMFSSRSTVRTTVATTGIDFETGTYKNYYLGLVKSPEGVISGTDCYDEFIVLINNKNAVNPTYAQLLTFLRADNTDEYPYQYVISPLEFYYGSAESNLDLEKIKNIIDGIISPDDPNICADFAERLHNNAEKAGMRCGYISLNFDTGEGHALNVFETTDRGLIYIDDTGTFGYGPSNCDKIVDVQVGEDYIPVSLFPVSGWSSTWGDMGIVTDIFITWDGEWN